MTERDLTILAIAFLAGLLTGWLAVVVSGRVRRWVE